MKPQRPIDDRRLVRCAILAAVVTALVALPGCGARVGNPEVVVAPSAGLPSAPPSSHQLSSGSAVAPASPDPLVTLDSDVDRELRQDRGTEVSEARAPVVRVHVAHQCVTRGGVQVVRVSAPPRAQLSLGVAFADGGPHGAMAIAVTDDAGRYDWQVPVAPDVPPGPAIALVGSSGPNQGDGGGTADARFLVADRCR